MPISKHNTSKSSYWAYHQASKPCWYKEKRHSNDWLLGCEGAYEFSFDNEKPRGRGWTRGRFWEETVGRYRRDGRWFDTEAGDFSQMVAAPLESTAEWDRDLKIEGLQRRVKELEKLDRVSVEVRLVELSAAVTSLSRELERVG